MAKVVTVSDANGVKRFKATDSIATFQGEKLDKPIPFTYEWDEYGTKEAAISAQKWPDNVDPFVLKQVNRNSKASAMSGARSEALKDKMAEYMETPAYKRKQLIDSIVAAGKSQAEAEAFADSIMG